MYLNNMETTSILEYYFTGAIYIILIALGYAIYRYIKAIINNS